MLMSSRPNYTQAALDMFTTSKGEYTLGQQSESTSFAFSLDPTDMQTPSPVRSPCPGRHTSSPSWSLRAPMMLPTVGLLIHPTRDHILIITGAANCYISSISNGTQLDTARSLFPSVADNNFSTYVVPDTGHGINYRMSHSFSDP